MDNAKERQKEENLTSLLEENPSDDEMESTPEDPWRRQLNLTNKSVWMPQFRKNSWLGVVLDLEERIALRELSEAPNLIIKPSDKGGNIVLLSKQNYEDEILRQLFDESTYARLVTNSFPMVIDSLSYKLLLAFEASLLTKNNVIIQVWLNSMFPLYIYHPQNS